MTIEEISKEIPFHLDLDKYKKREELLSDYDKHLSIIAVKAEIAGDSRLTNAIDIVRKYLPDNENLVADVKKQFYKAVEIVNSYIKRYSEEGLKEEQMLKDEISIACEEADKTYQKYLNACNFAKELEKKYRNKYGKSSGIMSEDFYNE